MKNSEKCRLFLLLFLALIVRLYKVTLIKCIAADGTEYLKAASDIIAGRGFNSIWPPLYPWFIIPLLKIGMAPELSGQLVSVFFGTATVAMVYVLTKAISSQRIALVSTVFSAFHPFLVRYSSEVLADSQFTFLLTSTVFCGWLAMQRGNFPLVLFTGLLTALAYLTKPEGIFILAVITIWWVFKTNELKWYNRLIRIFCAWAVFFIISFPYFYSIREETGRWMISQKASITFSVALQDEGYADAFLNISPFEYAKRNPKAFMIKTLTGFMNLIGKIPDAYHPLLFLFLVIGIIAWRRERKFPFYVLGFLILFFIGYSIFHPGRRYLVGWVPLTLFLSAGGVVAMSNKFIKKDKLLVFAITLVMLLGIFKEVRVGGEKWKKAGLWIKANAIGKARIMSEGKQVVFYAGGEHISWMEDEFNKADFVVTEEEIGSLKRAYCISGTSGGVNIYFGKERKL